VKLLVLLLDRGGMLVVIVRGMGGLAAGGKLHLLLLLLACSAFGIGIAARMAESAVAAGFGRVAADARALL